MRLLIVACHYFATYRMFVPENNCVVALVSEPYILCDTLFTLEQASHLTNPLGSVDGRLYRKFRVTTSFLTSMPSGTAFYVFVKGRPYAPWNPQTQCQASVCLRAALDCCNTEDPSGRTSADRHWQVPPSAMTTWHL